MAQEAILIKEKGVVTLNKSFDFMCSQLRNGRYRLIIERYTEPRTLSQNAWCGFGLPASSRKQEQRKNVVHKHYCRKFLSETAYFQGIEEEIVRGTSELNTVQMTDFFE